MHQCFIRIGVSFADGFRYAVRQSAEEDRDEDVELQPIFYFGDEILAGWGGSLVVLHRREEMFGTDATEKVCVDYLGKPLMKMCFHFSIA
jgi:hypothetical protein